MTVVTAENGLLLILFSSFLIGREKQPSQLSSVTANGGHDD